MADLSRRKALGLMAAVSIPPAGVVAAAPSVIDHDGITALNTLIASRKAAIIADQAAWDAAGEIECSPAMEATPFVRVQTSRLLKGRAHDGSDIWEPMYSYSKQEIEKVFRRHLDSQLAFASSGEKGDALRAKWTASFEAKMRAKIDELEALQSEEARVEAECGYTAAMTDANATADEVKRIERLIVGFVPTTLTEAAALAAWIIEARAKPCTYLEDEDFKAVLETIASAGRDLT